MQRTRNAGSGGRGDCSSTGGQELAEAVDPASREAGPDPGGPVVVDLDQHLALPVEGGQDVAPFVGDRQLDHGVEGPQPVGQGLQEGLHALPGGRRHRHRPQTLQHHQRFRLGGVELVGQEQLGDVAGAQFP
jgi:hypothetical protein